MEWEQLKQTVYRRDGGLRDIYVRDASRADWAAWIALVNRDYPVQWTVEEYNDQAPACAIDANFIAHWWDDEERTSTSATIFLAHIHVQCYFFGDFELENDICPSEIQCLADHERLMQYLVAVSLTLGKEVVMTEEAIHDAQVFVRVNGRSIHYEDIVQGAGRIH
ncbi:hypothetical protein [Hymenobacter terrestris]|uniref:DUF4274 domain-containing protein n=2 Tax=Hymenobacter TaxID=89966 RepID=A0ABX2Q617_9BACT|nr:hypothetical protein [Hymenobacter terrestris]NVO86410.1 hypothetical protein [Hymenobacter terrestris]